MQIYKISYPIQNWFELAIKMENLAWEVCIVDNHVTKVEGSWKWQVQMFLILKYSVGGRFREVVIIMNDFTSFLVILQNKIKEACIRTCLLFLRKVSNFNKCFVLILFNMQKNSCKYFGLSWLRWIFYKLPNDRITETQILIQLNVEGLKTT